MTLCAQCKLVKDRDEFDPSSLKQPLEKRICNSCVSRLNSKGATSTSQKTDLPGDNATLQSKTMGPKVVPNPSEVSKCENCHSREAVQQSSDGLSLCIQCHTKAQKQQMESSMEQKSSNLSSKRQKSQAELERSDEENAVKIHQDEKSTVLLYDDSEAKSEGPLSALGNPPIQAFDDAQG